MNLLRVDAQRFSVVIDAEREEYGVSKPQIRVREFEVLRETPGGYWIYDGRQRWVSKTSRKRFAYPTLAEAKESFRQRKLQQIRILGARLRRAQEDLALLKTEDPFTESAT